MNTAAPAVAVAAPTRWPHSIMTHSNKRSSSTPAMPRTGRASPFSPVAHPRSHSRNDFQASTHNASVGGGWTGTKSPDYLFEHRTRAGSVHLRDKQPDRTAVNNIYDPSDLHPNSSSTTTFSTFENGIRADPSKPQKRSRNSFFGVSSEALIFKKLIRKKKAPQNAQASFLPEVIEITATKRVSAVGDTEEEERERLRDAAAQSIGVDPGIMTQKPVWLEDEGEEEQMDRAESYSLKFNPSIKEGEIEHMGRVDRSLSFSSQQNIHNRHRAGSLAQSIHHRRSSSVPQAQPVPLFPTTVGSLTSFAQLSAVLPKYYPAPSLLKFSLSKQWKTRYIVMTTPIQAITTAHRPSSAPTVSYLHIFKSDQPFEKEVERLEINEDSVIFVNENNEEIAGRRNILRIGGADCGATKKLLNDEENGRTMWVLQVTDTVELQRWISNVKNSVLGQRSVRAGLGLPSHSFGRVEPRGDLDVMLSIRAQGMSYSPTNSGPEFNRARGFSVTSHPSVSHEQSVASSSHSVQSTSPSVRSQSYPGNTRSTISTTAVSALKGLFSGSNRPRSPSLVMTSHVEDAGNMDESFSSKGNNVFTMLRSSHSPVEQRPLSPLSIQILPTPVITPALLQYESQLEKTAHDPPHLDRWPSGKGSHHVDDSTLTSMSRAEQRSFAGSSALPPAPRRRPYTAGASLSPLDSGSYNYTHANSSTAESLGVIPIPNISPTSPVSAQATFGAAGRKPRVPSWSSTSSFTSGTSCSDGSGSKRWSRQGAIPRMMTPPDGSPPPIPATLDDGASTPRIQPHQQYMSDESPSPSPSTKSGRSPNSVFFNVAQFSKRASGSSFQSGSTVSSHNRAGPNRPGTSNRISIPPSPWPAPNTALPPTPIQDGAINPPSPTSSTRTTFRDTFAHLAMRPSSAGQSTKVPPSTSSTLQPDDDEIVFNKRNNSIESAKGGLVPSHYMNGGTLDSQLNTESDREYESHKQRLQMLSGPAHIYNPRVITTDLSFLSSSPVSAGDESFPSVHTRFPVGELATSIQNDPSILLLPTPVISPPTPPPSSSLDSPMSDRLVSPTSSIEMPEIASLSPPPWQLLRRTSVQEDDNGQNEQGDHSSLTTNPLISLGSPPALSSAISIANLSF